MVNVVTPGDLGPEFQLGTDTPNKITVNPGAILPHNEEYTQGQFIVRSYSGTVSTRTAFNLYPPATEAQVSRITGSQQVLVQLGTHEIVQVRLRDAIENSGALPDQTPIVTPRSGNDITSSAPITLGTGVGMWRISAGGIYSTTRVASPILQYTVNGSSYRQIASYPATTYETSAILLTIESKRSEALVTRSDKSTVESASGGHSSISSVRIRWQNCTVHTLVIEKLR